MIDLHTHTIFSDGALIPGEFVRRAYVTGYRAVALTDHVDASNMAHVLENVGRFAREQGHFYDMTVLAGVELTHLPPALIADGAERARALGAQVVVVHGETLVEPVAPGTNLAAIEAGVDILAHPGLITDEEAALAAEKGVLLEITTRGGHSLSNGHVAALARRHGAPLVINNDAHAPGDQAGAAHRKAVALGAGMTPEEFSAAEDNAREVVRRVLGG